MRHSTACSTRDLIAPIVGMTFTWSLFRAPSFILLAYPISTAIPIWGISVPANWFMPLAVLAAACIAFIRILHAGANAGKISESRSIIILGSLLGLVGLTASYCVQAGLLPRGYLVPSAVLTGCSMAYALTHWGVRLSRMPTGPRTTAILISYLLNLLLFLVTYDKAIAWPLAIATPLGSILPLFFCLGPAMAKPRAFSWKALRQPSICMLLLFMFAGSAIRGTTAQTDPASDIRSYVAVTLALALLMSWALYACLHNRRIDKSTRSSSITYLRYMLIWIAAIMVVFFIGVLLCLSNSNPTTGSLLITSLRITLSVLYLCLICETAFQKQPELVSFFLLYETIPWSISQVLGYGIVPQLTGVLDIVSDEAVVLASAFCVICMLIVLCTALIFTTSRIKSIPPLAEPRLVVEGHLPHGTVSQSTGSSGISTPMDPFANPWGLTEREKDVAWLFARGYSLKKVAEELGIGKSTAQSHIKSTYRKLGIHSKDELVELMGPL